MLAERTARWCRHCDEPVTVSGGDLAVHAGTGSEQCADGEHVAAPTVSDPAMRAAAKRIGKDHPRWLVAWDLTRFVAWSRDRPMTPPLEAATEDEMRSRLAAAGSSR